MAEIWMDILKAQVTKKGRPIVQRELNISSTTLSLVLAEKYGASTDAIEAKVMKFFGDEGRVNCPHLGKIEPGRCIDNWKRAQTTKTAGNPATIRLLIACRKCDLRNG